MLKGFYILIWITVFKFCFCQPRMGLGNESVLGKKYLVYFVKSPYSESEDDAWLCAGAIVSPTQILTAAACLVTVNNIYAIAGYKKYVHANDIEKDKCANTCKKKIVKISVPKEYTASNAKELEWMNVDIGVATVQEPYDFNDQSYLAHCSYVPESIKVNYDEANEVENTRAIALGWGGRVKKAKAEKEKKLKPKLLKEATTNIIGKTFCIKLVSKNESKELMEKYILCASGNGFLGEEADETVSDPILEKQLYKSSISNPNNSTKNIDESNEMSSRKSSLLETCQNDHGSPLTTWVDAEEVILGVALNGICNPNFDCVGPRIYVSTVATANITKCLLETNKTKRKICNDQIDDKRYQVNDIEIHWPEELKKNSTSSVNNQKVPSYRRQNDQEEILYVRPTMNLRNVDESQNLQNDTSEQSQESLRGEPNENQHNMNQHRSRKENLKDDQELNPFYEPASPPQADQSGGPVNEEHKNQPENPPKRFVSQKREPQSQPLTNNFNEPQQEYQNKPELDTANQPQMGSYNQPPLDPYYNQPPMDSYDNQPQTESKNPPETVPYYQSQTKPNNQSPVIPNYQNSMDQNDQQMESFNQPSVASQNLPQLNHETKSNNPQRPMNNYNQQGSAFEPPQIGPSQADSYNQPQIESFRQPPLRKPPPKQFNNPQAKSESMISSQSKVNTLHNSQYSNRVPQSSHNDAGIEAFQPEPAEAYNPLDIIMADNENEELTLKQHFKQPPVERYKLPGAETYMPQSFKPSLDKPFQEPYSSQKYHQSLRQSGLTPGQSFDTSNPLNPLREQREYSATGEAPGQSFDTSNPLNTLREQREYSATGEPQTFEQMYSQLHAGPEPNMDGSDLAPLHREETFDEIYRNLHDGRPEEPLDQEYQPQNEQPILQEVEHTDARIVNESPVNVGETHQADAVQVQMRQQAPIDHADYQ